MTDADRIVLIDTLTEAVRNELSSFKPDAKIGDKEIKKIVDGVADKIDASADKLAMKIDDLREAVSKISTQVSIPEKLLQSAIEKAIKNIGGSLTSPSSGDAELRLRQRYNSIASTASWLFSIITLLFAFLFSYALGEVAYLWFIVPSLCPVLGQIIADPEYDEGRNYIAWLGSVLIPLASTIACLIIMATKLM